MRRSAKVSNGGGLVGRAALALLLGALWGIVLPALPATARAGNSLACIDREGNDLQDSAVPTELLTAARDVPLEAITLPDKPSALILARVLLPPSAPDRTFASELAGQGWVGGMHFASGPEDAVCIRLVDFEAPCKLVLSKPGYQSVEIAVPYQKAAGKIVWMGELPLGAAYAASAMATVKGLVVGPDGAPLRVAGEAILGGIGGKERRAPLADGAFAFPGVAPGRYGVELSLPGYAIEPWAFAVKEGGALTIERKLAATPRLTLRVRVHTRTTSPRDAELACGLPGQSVNLDVMPGERLRVDQQGARVALYSPRFKLAVASAAFTDLDVAAPMVPPGKNPWFSWNGPPQKGDLVILLTPKNRQAPDEARFEPAQVAAVVELLDVLGAPPK